jgi:hypothetical protein
MPPRTQSSGTAPVKKKALASVPSYAELLSASRHSKGGAKKKKAATEVPREVVVPIAPSSPPPQPDADPEGALGESTDVVAGCRVVLSTSGLFGTVRFVGSTTFQSGLWIGIELDSKQVRLDPASPLPGVRF